MLRTGSLPAVALLLFTGPLTPYGSFRSIAKRNTAIKPVKTRVCLP
jgi:hypothetical protein